MINGLFLEITLWDFEMLNNIDKLYISYSLYIVTNTHRDIVYVSVQSKYESYFEVYEHFRFMCVSGYIYIPLKECKTEYPVNKKEKLSIKIKLPEYRYLKLLIHIILI